jgi:hypothetical protein
MRSPALASKIFWGGLFVLLQSSGIEAFLSRRGGVAGGPSMTTARCVLQEKLSSEEIHSQASREGSCLQGPRP